MARRASSGPNPIVILAAVAAVALVIFVGKSIMGRKPSSFGDAAPLRIEDLLDNGNSLRNNEYVLKGEIDEKLQFSEDAQLVSVRVNGPHGDEFLGIQIPSQFNKLNLDARQRYEFRVKFKQGGIAVATGINRL